MSVSLPFIPPPHLIIKHRYNDSVSNRNQYQGFLLRDKDGRCVVLTTLLPSCAECQEILAASNSYGPEGLSRAVQVLIFLQCYIIIIIITQAICGLQILVFSRRNKQSFSLSVLAKVFLSHCTNY